MSLTTLINTPEVRKRFRDIQPPRTLNLNDRLLVPPRSARYATIGTAMDYLLRFEIERRVPSIKSDPWVAEVAVEYFCERVDRLTDRAGKSEFNLSLSYIVEQWYHALAMRNLVKAARESWKLFRAMKSPESKMTREMARHALRLAKLDPLVRAGWFDDNFRECDDEDVEELLAMLEIVPFDRLLPNRRRVYLNPTFGEATIKVGGADGDLIAGNMLVDFKCTKEGRVNASYINQLLGYFLLARRWRRRQPSFPLIRQVGIYFTRHGHLWTMDTSIWTEHPYFIDTERWFWRQTNSYSDDLFNI